jgi:pimeloyl-ACP methyl ester carboxylesterase
MKKSTNHIKPILILIPGNPGIAEYYKTFSDRIYQLTSSKYDIYTIDYAGFSLNPSNKLFSIQEEANHTIDKIQSIINESIQSTINDSIENTISESIQSKSQSRIFKNTSKLHTKHSNKSRIPSSSQIQITIVGHSIGAWITQEISKRDLDFSIQKIIYIFPFFHKDPHSKLQKFLGFLLNLPLLDKFILSFYYTLRIFPKTLLKKIMSPFLKKMNQNAKNVTWKYFVEHKHILKSVIFLARTEFQTLPYSLFLKDFSMIGNNKFILYNTDDLWAPFWAYECLVQIFPKENIDLYQGSIHDFSTTEEGIEWVSEKISQFLISNK